MSAKQPPEFYATVLSIYVNPSMSKTHKVCDSCNEVTLLLFIQLNICKTKLMTSSVADSLDYIWSYFLPFAYCMQKILVFNVL